MKYWYLVRVVVNSSECDRWSTYLRAGEGVGFRRWIEINVFLFLHTASTYGVSNIFKVQGSRFKVPLRDVPGGVAEEPINSNYKKAPQHLTQEANNNIHKHIPTFLNFSFLFPVSLSSSSVQQQSSATTLSKYVFYTWYIVRVLSSCVNVSFPHLGIPSCLFVSRAAFFVVLSYRVR